MRIVYPKEEQGNAGLLVYIDLGEVQLSVFEDDLVLAMHTPGEAISEEIGKFATETDAIQWAQLFIAALPGS